ncbi:MAG: tyrosine-type recombinase/integrase [Paeniclostridium sp.]|uniref:tyrosine-type recombinase/integrase n=1 Tax=Paraclostridium sordellii TaxID=1505 RepID=UPI0005EA636E|nr:MULTISPECIES: tyrosine-type recombinase/integrase [Paeniclostridium]MBW4862466.1 tyrosine-type recombinase/integrase [Paeniclostridium sp.]MBW4873431.1 tyrosine-type recombinase/integrase [Paeniclostridium sp.]CEN94275.1 integrase site-specific recombinase XerD-like [[Clostridium] sordellii] [Paeniclostridium sordellii]CEN96282.1 integrase site-specific recombinase XerD-like [[Clostridium] sordellii] [Paeniclostridium sordellii]
MQILDEYIRYIQSVRKLTENTVNSYLIDLKKYLTYIKNKNIDLFDSTENDIISYIIELEKTDVSTATISRSISSIKSFYEYLFLNRYTKSNVSKNIKKPKIEKKEIDILSEEEVEALLSFTDLKNIKNIRDKAIFEVLYGTGIKVTELIELDVDDVSLEFGYICCKIGKNPRVIPLTKISSKYIEKYLKESRNEILKTNYEEKALFINSNGSRFTRQGLWKLIKKHANRVNINKNINPTILRNSFAIHLLNKGANIAVVSKILGSTNLSSLQHYLDCMDKNLRQELKEKHPRK